MSLISLGRAPKRKSGRAEKRGAGKRLSRQEGQMAGVTGLEPAASGVTGQRSNRLSYTPKPFDFRPLGMGGREQARRRRDLLQALVTVKQAGPLFYLGQPFVLHAALPGRRRGPDFRLIATPKSPARGPGSLLQQPIGAAMRRPGTSPACVDHPFG